MPDPTDYERGYSFTGWAAANPSRPLPGSSVDNELDGIAAATTEIVEAVKDIRRSDGALQNSIVTMDSLADDVLAAIDPLQQVADIFEDEFPDTVYTLDIDGDKGRAKLSTSTSSVTVMLPADAPAGWSCIVTQGNTGPLAFAVASGATMRQESGLAKLYGQWSSASLRVAKNVGGNAAVWQLDGSFTG